MKKYCFLTLLVCIGPLAWAGPIDALSLRMIDEALQNKNFQATFIYHNQSDQKNHSTEKLTGTITVQGNQYRLVMNEQEIISNGINVWTYLPEAREVQINNYDPEHGAGVPWPLLTNYRQHYKFYNHRGEKKAAKKFYNVITLKAKAPENDWRQLVVTIASHTKHISRLEVIDSNQQRHIFSITKFAKNLKLDDAFFELIPEHYANTEVIDMR